MSWLDFDPLVGDVPQYPFKALRATVWMARSHLRGLDIDDVRQIERVVRDSLSEQRAIYVEQEMDSLIAGLLEHGGWELGYLPDAHEAGEREIRYLLEHWPSEADDRPNLPSEDDLSDVDALEQAIEANLPASPLGLTSDDPAKCAAVLALMLADESFDALGWDKDVPRHVRIDVKLVGLAAAADSAIEATRAVGLADRLRSEANLRSALSVEQRTQIDNQLVMLTKNRAKHAAEKRHSSMRMAKLFVQAEWDEKGEAYKRDKSDFARTYVGLVRDKFMDSKGDPLRVTEKTIREVWLSKFQSAVAR
jgi:hypothetical protein